MEWVSFHKKDGLSYVYQNGSSIGISVLGLFLYSDIGCNNSNFFRDWILSDESDWAVSGNITVLEKIGNDIYLRDQYSLEDTPTELAITSQQLVNLIDEWREKVCKKKPLEVVIKYENSKFFIETSN